LHGEAVRVVVNNVTPILLHRQAASGRILIDDRKCRLITIEKLAMLNRHLVVECHEHGWLKRVVNQCE